MAPDSDAAKATEAASDFSQCSRQSYGHLRFLRRRRLSPTDSSSSSSGVLVSSLATSLFFSFASSNPEERERKIESERVEIRGGVKREKRICI